SSAPPTGRRGRPSAGSVGTGRFSCSPSSPATTMADRDTVDVAPPPEHPDPLWDDWDVPLRVPGAPELHLDGFDGPLDLLLDLAERARIDLSRISISAVIDQFVAALVRYQTHVAIERRADWLVLATRLIVLRSRLLFAADPAEAEA